MENNDAVSFSMTPFSRITITAWIRLIGDGGGSLPYPRIVDLSFCRFLVTTDEGDRLRLDTDFDNLVAWRSDGDIQRSVWQHVAAVYDGGSDEDAVTFYINGVVQRTTLLVNPSRPAPAQHGSADHRQRINRRSWLRGRSRRRPHLRHDA